MDFVTPLPTISTSTSIRLSSSRAPASASLHRRAHKRARHQPPSHSTCDDGRNERPSTESSEVSRSHQSRSSEVHQRSFAKHLRKAPQAASRSAIRGHQWSSVVIRGNQAAITSSCQPICSVSSQRADFGGDGCIGRSWQRATRSAIGSPSSSSSVSYLMRQAIRGHQRSSEVIRGHQALLVPDEAGHQRPSEECAGAVGGAGAV